MKLEHEFYRLPYSFDVSRLAEEIRQFSEDDWRGHHENFAGNSAIPLVAVNGELNNLFKGPMAETKFLASCPYIRQIMAMFDVVISRSRLMRLAPGASVPLHTDINYHWHKRVRIHIPIITDPKVRFLCAEKQIHMAQGECWIFDSSRPHSVHNDSDVHRVHLVIDTQGTSKFWQIANQVAGQLQAGHSRAVAYQPSLSPALKFERYNFPVVMSPGELENLLREVKSNIAGHGVNTQADVAVFMAALDDFMADWRAVYSSFAEDQAGWPIYHQLRNRLHAAVNHLQGVVMQDGQQAIAVLLHLVLAAVLNPEVAPR